MSGARVSVQRRHAELIARSWVGQAAAAFPEEAALADAKRELTDTERVRLAQPLLTVARALLNRSGETTGRLAHNNAAQGHGPAA